MTTQTQRIDKFLANNGVCARRAVEYLLQDHTVTVNGARVDEPGVRIQETDNILIDGKKIVKEKLVYYMLNKPPRTVTTTSDEFDRRNVLEDIDSKERIYPVGRLDKDTTGLLILTNDGELTNKLTHPRYGVDKTYQLVIHESLSDNQRKRLEEGVELSDGKTAPAKVTNIRELIGRTQFDLSIHEGRNRMIRRMGERVGIQIITLKRVRIGSLKLGDLKEGAHRELSSEEVKMLKDKKLEL